jgi:hypothetical protein
VTKPPTTGDAGLPRRSVLLGLASFCALPGVASAAAKPISLFDGKTLNGWHAIPRTPAPPYPGGPEPDHNSDYYRKAMATHGHWIVENGAIVGGQDPPGSGLGAYLLSDDVFGDFELTIDANPDWPADTGVLVRTTVLGSQGFQIHVDHRRQGSIGTIYGNGIGSFRARHYAFDVRRDAGGRPVGLQLLDVPESEKKGLLYAADPREIIRVWKFLDWNTIRIRVAGAMPRLTTWINGMKVVEFDAAQYEAEHYDRKRVLDLLGPRGHIALEVHNNDANLGLDRWGPGAVCRWKNIVVTPLG